MSLFWSCVNLEKGVVRQHFIIPILLNDARAVIIHFQGFSFSPCYAMKFYFIFEQSINISLSIVSPSFTATHAIFSVCGIRHDIQIGYDD